MAADKPLRALGPAYDPLAGEVPSPEAYHTMDLSDAGDGSGRPARPGGAGLLAARPGLGRTFAPGAWAGSRHGTPCDWTGEGGEP